MLGQLRNLFKVQELRTRILWTFGLLLVYRLGFYVPLPGVDGKAFSAYMVEGSSAGIGELIGFLNKLAAGNVKMPVLFALGILPYISSSIIFSLLSKVLPSLEALAKEGAAGQRKINQYSRLTTVPLAFIQGLVLCKNFDQLQVNGVALIPNFGWGFILGGALAITAGTVFLMWVGEQITEYGIGNGSSLLIVTGIVSDVPTAFYRLIDPTNPQTYLTAAILAVTYFLIVIGVVYTQRGQRRIPMQSAKMVRGGRMMGGQKHYLPVKLNMPSVMPVIFASSLIMLPLTLIQTIRGQANLPEWIGSGTCVHVTLYCALIVFFSFFWTSLMFQPTEIADNLKENGAFIPGIRPGKDTASYLESVLSKVTLLGAFFLALVAIIPEVASKVMSVDYFTAGFLGGTGILIVVGVALDIVDKLNASLMQRNYEGFMGGAKKKSN
jgi:preprotein translocase subunit SecY